jgi:hypothetical protein
MKGGVVAWNEDSPIPLNRRPSKRAQKLLKGLARPHKIMASTQIANPIAERRNGRWVMDIYPKMHMKIEYDAIKAEISMPM